MYAFALTAKTMSRKMVGKKCIEGTELLTRKGVCPVCGKQVERSYTDIFFPYCGYTCKRVVQRKEEKKEKEKILRQQKLVEDMQNRYRIKREKENLSLAHELKIQEIRARIAQCESEYQKSSKEADLLPKRCEKRWRAQERARSWYGKMVKARNMLDELQKGEEERNDSCGQADLEVD